MKQLLSSAEAAEALGITRATLYAYVSRGLIRSEAVAGSRARRYRREEVEALSQRKELRADPGKAAAGTLDWGMPVLDSAITLIRGGQLYYRGRSATDLAVTRRFEEVASLLWTGDMQDLPDARLPAVTARRLGAAAKAIGPLPAFEGLQVLVPLAGALDPASFDLRPAALRAAAPRLLQTVVAIAAGDWSCRRPVAETLLGAWAPAWRNPAATRLVDAALILAADHELNVSAFSGRCVASAGSPLHAVVSAGLAALQGSRHGGHCDRVEALFKEAGSAGRARETMAARLRRGEAIPGCNHRLYPEGDPRGRLLLDLASGLRPRSGQWALARALAGAMEDLLGARPSIDFGLVTAARVLDLPPRSAIALFAAGRTAGWIGHALEQYGQETMIRPRARYTGPAPD